MARYRVCLFNRFGSLFFANVFDALRDGDAKGIVAQGIYRSRMPASPRLGRGGQSCARDARARHRRLGLADCSWSSASCS
jgi:hypothetical protein